MSLASAHMIAKTATSHPVAQSSTHEQETTPTASSSTKPHDMERPRKRQKTKHTDEEGNAVAFSDDVQGSSKQVSFSELPTDVFLEIAGYCEPLDLLNLSYTSKSIRLFLTNDCYAPSAWKQAYMNIAPGEFSLVPPACPEGVEIWHYTSVLFGTNCLSCANSKGTIVHWSALTRLCEACAQTHLTRLKYNRLTNYVQRMCWECKIQDTVLTPGIYVLNWDYERHVRALQQCADDDKQDQLSRAQVHKKQQDDGFRKTLEAWGAAQAAQNKYDLGVVRRERREAIRMKLDEEGQGYTNIRKPPFESLPCVNIAAPLGDEEWDKIKGDIISTIERVRQTDKEKKMTKAFADRSIHLGNLMQRFEKKSKPWIHPPLSTIAGSEPFASIMQQFGKDAHEVSIRATMSGLADHIPEMIKTWRTEADEYLLSLLSKTETPMTRTDSEAIDRTPLELATTFFKCPDCPYRDPISYPRILIHHCLRENQNPNSGDEPQEAERRKEAWGVPIVTADYVWRKMPLWLCPTWNEARCSISVDEMATKSAKAIVQACGEDPETFMATAMNNRNVRLECTRCVATSGRGLEHVAVSWNFAILHDLLGHPDDISKDGWRLVTAKKDLARVQELEAKILREERSGLRSYHVCLKCGGAVNINDDEAFDHLRKIHKIDLKSNPERLQEHVYKSLDAPMATYPEPVGS